MRLAILGMAAGALALGTTQAATADDPADAPAKRTYKDKDGKALPYRLVKPAKVEDGRKYPLVLFLHGAGERGDDNERQLIHAVPEFLKAENRERFPCFLAAPQCPKNQWWSALDRKAGTIAAEPSEPGRLALELVESLKGELPIDPDRVYITGLSMGGYGTWDLLARHPDRFAAAVPVCGGGDPSQAEKFARVPVWAFHGATDNVVPPRQSRDMIAALQKADAHPGYTEYPDVGHASWVPAYREPGLFPWLFSKKRG